MRIIGILTSAAIVAAGIAFSVLNAQSVKINYLLGKTEMPLAMLLLLALIIGMLVSLLIFGWPIIKLKSQNRSLKSKLKKLEQTTSE